MIALDAMSYAQERNCPKKIYALPYYDKTDRMHCYQYSQFQVRSSYFPKSSNACEPKYSPKAAAVQCAIMKPEFRPPSVTKNGGNSLSDGLQSRSILLSLIAASSWTPIAR